MDRLERVLGGLFGVACGDALGGTLEFTREYDGVIKYGYHKEIIGGGRLNLIPGQVTDDTMMTIAVAEGVLENPQSPVSSIGKGFINWYKTNPPDIGITCRSAIEEYSKCGDWNEAAVNVHEYFDGKTAGNGTLMRCIAPALYYSDFSKMVEVTKAQSDMTHYDEEAAEACIIYNTMVYRYLKGEDKIEVFNEVTKDFSKYSEVLSWKKERLRPSGYVVDTLQCALWCFLNNSTPEEIICEAVNLYGDPDTIGAIAGGLAGVYYGYSSIPERWKEKLLVREELMKLGKKLS